MYSDMITYIVMLIYNVFYGNLFMFGDSIESKKYLECFHRRNSWNVILYIEMIQHIYLMYSDMITYIVMPIYNVFYGNLLVIGFLSHQSVTKQINVKTYTKRITYIEMCGCYMIYFWIIPWLLPLSHIVHRNIWFMFGDSFESQQNWCSMYFVVYCLFKQSYCSLNLIVMSLPSDKRNQGDNKHYHSMICYILYHPWYNNHINAMAGLVI